MYRLSDEPIVACCFGASPAPCPCDDHGAPGNGCANRQHPEGANLAASAPGGDPQVSDDDVVLTAQGMRSFSWCLFLQGTGQVDFGLGEPFGAGLLCAGGELTRLGFKSTGPGMASYPGPHDEPLSLRGGIPPGGGTAFYQVVYRTPLLLGLCGPEGRGFNSTIAVAISWTP